MTCLRIPEKIPRPPMASVLPSGLNATGRIQPALGVSVFFSTPVPGSHNRTLSAASAPLARVSPLGLNARCLISVVCPVSLCRSCPVCISHNRTVLSLLPEARVSPFGEIATTSTTCVCPVRVLSTCHVVVFHNRNGLIRASRNKDRTIWTEHDRSNSVSMVRESSFELSRVWIP